MKQNRKKAAGPHRLRIVSVSILFLCGLIIFSILLTVNACNNAHSYNVRSYSTVLRESKAQTDNILAVPYISQEGTMPTGCELVSAVMVLHYYGCNISVDDFADNYVDMGPITFLEDGTMTAPNPNEAFVGNPQEYASYGCYAPVIANAINRVTDGSWQAQTTTGTSLEQLTQQYVWNGTPALVWVTIEMRESYEGSSWLITGTDDWFTWLSNEHCMVLVGADDSSYYLLDPYNSNGLVQYDKSLVTQRFAEMGSQSVVLQ